MPTNRRRLPPLLASISLADANVGTDRVDSPSSDWHTMAQRWELLDDLLGGTQRMRLAGTRWLPQEPKESAHQYTIRLHRGVLFEGFKDTITKLESKPFSRKVSVRGELPDQIETVVDNVDRQGNNLSSFARLLVHDGLVYGKSHFLVDFPRTGGTQTFADEARGGARPYFTHVPAKDLIGWRSDVDPTTGERFVTQVRILERFEDESGEFATQTRERIRVLEPGAFRIFEKNQDGEWIVVDEGEVRIGGEIADRIPLVTVYFNRTGFLTANPPLEGLAWLNLAHWQSGTDHRNYLRFIRIGILFASGFAPEEIERGITISPNQLSASKIPEADLKYVEHGGSAFDAGVKDLEMLEDRMETMGLQPLVEGSARSTATGKAIDENRQDSQMQAWIRATEDALVTGFRWAAMWSRVELPEDFGVDIFNDFRVAQVGASDVDRLIAMRQSTPPLISHETFVREVRRRNILAETVDPEEEREAISQEMLEMIGGGFDQPET